MIHAWRDDVTLSGPGKYIHSKFRNPSLCLVVGVTLLTRIYHLCLSGFNINRVVLYNLHALKLDRPACYAAQRVLRRMSVCLSESEQTDGQTSCC